MKLLKRLAQAVVLVGLICLLAEGAIRWGIANGNKELRNPDLFADWTSDDNYWKLRHLWGRPVAGDLGRRHDPLLGWLTPPKPTAVPAQDRAALLGDAFWESIAAAWPQEAAIRPYYLGELGYGYDQTLLRFQQYAYHSPESVALIGLFTAGVDRNVLSFRTGPKPYFIFNEGQLVLRGTPVEKNVETYLAEHPPEISSYLWAAIKRTRELQKSPSELEVSEHRESKEHLATAILDQVLQEAREHQTRLGFVLFYYPEELSSEGWRERFLKNYLRERNLSFVDTKEILNAAAQEQEHSPRLFYARTGHLNEEGAGLVANEISRRLTAGSWVGVPRVPLN